ncbi:hypothetical protein [Nocardioides sp. Soil805]|uniref:hypothetical protein n=1 Tax=Nocardioides sp. Soil805 TaxID=1736416 RepID=UPI000702D582|nr:hypothetical protein [Nocardioides sp. Soil805]KRF30567.1 hypothetical protein ASG94_18725 [Nocardioides sp. Soil805]
MRSLRRTSVPDVAVGPGERVLAWCRTDDDRVLVGTRDALYVAGGDADARTRIPWERVEAADWDSETDVLRVSLVGSWGEQRVEHALGLVEPGRLLELVRERVTASVVLQRHVALSGRRGVRVIGRRAPRGDASIEWFYEYDEGVDPDDPAVRTAASEALAEARADVGST